RPITDRARAPTTAPVPPAEAPPLTDADRAAGWRPLFDGVTSAGWRAFRRNAFPADVSVTDGMLVANGPATPIASTESFDDFELALRFRVFARADGGLCIRVDERTYRPYESASEIQLIDPARADPGMGPLAASGAAYGLFGPPRHVARPVGEWNDLRVVARGPHVEHWLNGERVVDYTVGSPEWDARLAAFDAPRSPDFGHPRKGPIVLLFQNGRIAYRDVRIRPLPPATKPPGGL
ncbi:MAG TPA: DUF1080 domain-containing protein, partial [Tepidisphaeraceae bacterium]|nr:DUF1080 domain-containing protein [Tepidisphaeraceae bacterium]